MVKHSVLLPKPFVHCHALVGPLFSLVYGVPIYGIPALLTVTFRALLWLFSAVDSNRVLVALLCCTATANALCDYSKSDKYHSHTFV